MEQNINIGGRLHSAATGNTVAGANEILDDDRRKKQNVINNDIYEEIGTDSTEGSIKGRIKQLENAIGEGGSIDSQIENHINRLDATATKSAGTDGLSLSVTEENGKIKEITGSIKENTYAPASDSERITSLENAVGAGGSVDERISNAVGSEASLRSSADSTLQNNINTETLRAQAAELQLNTYIQALSQSQPVPKTAAEWASMTSYEEGVIYRVAGTTSYADYMYNGTTTIKMAEYNNAIDNRPTVGSENLVKSGGVVTYVDEMVSVEPENIEGLVYGNFNLISVTGGRKANASNNRVTTYINVSGLKSVKYEIPTGFKILYILLNKKLESLNIGDIIPEGNVIRISSWMSTSGILEFNDNENCVILSVGKTDDSNLTPSDVSVSLKRTSCRKGINRNSKALFEKTTKYIKSSVKANIINGVVTRSNNRASLLFDIYELKELKVSINSNYKALYYFLYSDTQIDSINEGDNLSTKIVDKMDSWSTGVMNIDFLTGKYTHLIVTIGKSNDAQITLDEAENALSIEGYSALYRFGVESYNESKENNFVAVQSGVRAWYLFPCSSLRALNVVTNKNELYQISFVVLHNDTLLYSSDWGNSVRFINTLSNVNNIRLSVRRYDDEAMTGEEIAYINSTYVTSINLTLTEPNVKLLPAASIDDVKYLYDNIYGVGNKVYYGKKINLNLNQEQRVCNLTTLKEFDTSGEYVFQAAQSATIYGKYMFIANHNLNSGSNGDLVVVNMDTLLPVDKFSYGDTSYDNHANNIQFTNVFYNESDDFPLCLISYWDVNQQTSVAGECMVVRITKDSNDNFSGSIISRINTEENSPYMTWGVDSENKKLIAYKFSNDNTAVSSGHVIDFFQWELPNDLTINHTLSLSDAVKNTINHNCIGQGFFAKNGKIYWYTTSESGYPKDIEVGVWVIDEGSFEIESIIPIPRVSYEPEGIAAYYNDLILVDKNASGNLRINEIEL